MRTALIFLVAGLVLVGLLRSIWRKDDELEKAAAS
jgi:hypothetical protein